MRIRKHLCIPALLVFMVVFISTAVSNLISANNTSGAKYEEMAVDPTSSGDGFSAVLYDNTNGLPTSEANAIAETEEGFIWIGSYSGLIRYDGNTFERIDSTTGVASVVSLYVDSKNRLWVGTNDNGIALMEKGVFRLFGTEDGLSSYSIRSIVDDGKGNIYIATAQGISIIDADMNVKKLDEVQINNEYINELRITEGGTIYGKTSDGDIFTIDDGRLSNFYNGSKLGIGNIKSILPDPYNDGYLFIGTEQSKIYHGHLSNGFVDNIEYDVSPLETVTSMEIYNGDVWVCSDRGIGVINSSGFHKLENLPVNNSIDQMLVDYEGNLWFTSSRQGVMKIVPNQFTDLFKKYNLESTVVNSTCICNGNLFVATDTGLIVLGSDGKVKESVPIELIGEQKEEFSSCTDLIELLKGCRIRSIIRDSKDRIWISTYSKCGLVMYDNGNVIRFDADMGMPSNKIRAIYENSSGQILVACSGGLAVIENDKIVDKYTEDVGLNNIEVLTVSQTDSGDIIIGTNGSGIYIIKDHKIRNLGKKDGLWSEVIMRLKRDRVRDIYWIVTSNSIAYMTSDYSIHTVANFPYSNNFDLYQNSQDEMWILASNGIYVSATEDLIKNKAVNPVFFSRANGLPCITTANSYSDISSDGNIYIAGSTGVAKVNIEKAFLDVSKIKMAVPYVSADGVLIYPDSSGKITIPSDTNRLTIYSYVFTYSLSNPKVTYWLKGFDDQQTTIFRSEMEPLDYTNLDGGNYHFHMVLRDAVGNGDKEIDVLIVKEKAYYEKTWFKLLLAFLILGTVFIVIKLAVRRKTHSLLKKEEQNKLFVREMTQAFAKTIDMKDRYTNGHSERVAKYTAMLAEELGYSEEDVEKYFNIALLHDIGKISIPPEVLNKEGKLTDEEFKIIKSHSARGYQVLKDISIMPELAIGAGAHHERPDGKGYPKGLHGEEIPRVAQIIAVADTFDAMYSDRPYRKRMNFEKVVSIIKEVSGTQLTEDVVDAFLRIVERGGFRDPEDNGGGSLEDIDNIHKNQRAENQKTAEKESKDKEK